MKKKLVISYEDIISLDNMLLAWQEFIIGKRNRMDVIKFSLNLADNILHLNRQLANLKYSHGSYHSFYVVDPKLRHIHKASVFDRLIHHAIYRKLYPFFSKTFIAHSYSCQTGKGTHRALRDFETMANKVSQNNTRTCWILQCDIRKFFDSIDHRVLLKILDDYIIDKRIIWLLKNIINSFAVKPNKGLPLGNLTSQLLVNIYMNIFDQYVKHELKIKYYIRYADDFVFLTDDRDKLVSILPKIETFLFERLKLRLHPHKLHIKTLVNGVDFLGWIHFPEYKILRVKTKKRMMRKIKDNARPESLASYLGLLKHGNSYKTEQELLNNYWINYYS
jgi:retron-type reverse transcriptase